MAGRSAVSYQAWRSPFAFFGYNTIHFELGGGCLVTRSHEMHAILEHCKNTLDFTILTSDPQSYQHLPACVVDTVFSIGARYTSTSNTVMRFCTQLGLTVLGTNPRPPTIQQFSLSDFLALYETASADTLARTLYQNSQRTSTRNGILKAEAVQRFGQVLQTNKVEYLQDVDRIIGQTSFEQAIQQIPGQRSGISLRYFYILTGSANHVKPDRMILRFIKTATGRLVSIDEAESAIRQACALLQPDYPKLTLARLDNIIWRYQQTQGSLTTR
jgi:hypothetical protein